MNPEEYKAYEAWIRAAMEAGRDPSMDPHHMLSGDRFACGGLRFSGPSMPLADVGTEELELGVSWCFDCWDKAGRPPLLSPRVAWEGGQGAFRSGRLFANEGSTNWPRFDGKPILVGWEVRPRVVTLPTDPLGLYAMGIYLDSEGDKP